MTLAANSVSGIRARRRTRSVSFSTDLTGDAQQLLGGGRPRGVSFSNQLGRSGSGDSDSDEQLQGAQIKLREAAFAAPNTPDGMMALTPLMVNARKGDAAFVKALLRNGADSNMVDKRGYDALMYAVRDGHIQVMDALLKHGGARPDLYEQQHSNLSHIMYAAINGHADCVVLLLQHNCDPNKADHTGFTPLMGAAQNGHLDVVRVLLGLRKPDDPAALLVNANAQDHLGMTATAYASYNGMLEIISALVVDGRADINIVARSGRSPLFWSVGRGHSDVGQFLMKNGAKVCDAVRLLIIKDHLRGKKKAAAAAAAASSSKPGPAKAPNAS